MASYQLPAEMEIGNQYKQKEDLGLMGNSRNNFIKKVYSILTMQLLTTVLMTYASMRSYNFLVFQIENIGLFYIALVASIIIELIIFCNPGAARNVPNNYIFLFLFTLCWAYMISFICSSVGWNDDGTVNEAGQYIVLIAAVMTCGITASLTLYACTTKSDFTMKGGSLFLLANCVFFFGFFTIFCGTDGMYTFYCLLCCMVYGLYLIYDTQLIMGGKFIQLSIDDYIIGALLIYIDIIVLFLRILRILLISMAMKKK